MRFQVIRDVHFIRLQMTGRLTVDDAPVMQVLISELVSTACQRVLIDAVRLTSVDLAGVGLLLILNANLNRAGQTVALTNLSHQVRRIADTARLGMIIPIYPTMADFIEEMVPEMVVIPLGRCAEGEDPMAVAARNLTFTHSL